MVDLNPSISASVLYETGLNAAVKKHGCTV